MSWGIPVSSVILLGIGLGLYRSAKGRYSRWDGEDEDLAEGIEISLSYVLLFTALAVILDFFFLSESGWAAATRRKKPRWARPPIRPSGWPPVPVCASGWCSPC
ncbi:DUF3169 family protein [Intestinimonas massiliensis (ex Afouda et al. 2020)]|uniref:DUF3169 family protein n=1 Tax=Intestinimonas massiliensis (ex Afouda et al. 2020) TaxID=1673721 RepID=UPI0013EF1515|nr:DUF3169 family protein [Intestinimonas massiliensis (ex Afouda et al. 2020)]